MTVNTAVMGMMVIMMPFFFMAMYERNGQMLEGHFEPHDTGIIYKAKDPSI